MDIDGLLLDIDGVLSVSWEPIDGAIDTLGWLREEGIPFRLITNTTTHPRDALALTLRDAGFTVDAAEIVTAVVATAEYLRAHHSGERVFLLSDGDARGDLEDIELVGADERADVVVIGGASDEFSYATLNHIFRLLTEGAALVGMHRNMYWRTAEGLELDGGAYIAGLEEATGTRATICGKPAPEYFHAALEVLGVPPDRAAMVGDDVANDVLAAQQIGMTGVLVRTGKFRAADLEHTHGTPDHVIASFADLPTLLRTT
ncbi:MAG: TIGR01458 family HAD-type hydrolase [Actinomycetota bacterium]